MHEKVDAIELHQQQSNKSCHLSCVVLRSAGSLQHPTPCRCLTHLCRNFSLHCRGNCNPGSSGHPIPLPCLWHGRADRGVGQGGIRWHSVQTMHSSDRLLLITVYSLQMKTAKLLFFKLLQIVTMEKLPSVNSQSLQFVDNLLRCKSWFFTAQQHICMQISTGAEQCFYSHVIANKPGSVEVQQTYSDSKITLKHNLWNVAERPAVSTLKSNYIFWECHRDIQLIFHYARHNLDC